MSPSPQVAPFPGRRFLRGSTVMPALFGGLLLAACTDSDPVHPREAQVAAAQSAVVFPDLIALPAGFSPEGIAMGTGTDFYVGSLRDGSVIRGDVRTGAIEPLVAGQPGALAVGLDVDPRSGLLFVAGGSNENARVYDTGSGALVASFPTAGGGFVNDVIVTRESAYFTDSFLPVLYRLPLDGGGMPAPGATAEVLPLGGDFVSVPGAFNANGIVATPDGSALVVVNGSAGELYRVDPATGEALEIDLGGDDVLFGDGLILEGRTLYVVQNFLNQIAKIRLAPDLASGSLEGVITSAAFRIPTTADRFGDALYAVNARFDVAPPGGPNDVEFEVVRVPR